VRELRRQFDSALYERLALSRDKEGIRRLASEGQTVAQGERPGSKEPPGLECLGLDEANQYSESDLESAIIGQISSVSTRTGKWLPLRARQSGSPSTKRHFFVDLVFYNRHAALLRAARSETRSCRPSGPGARCRCTSTTDRFVKTRGNPTIGILLCKAEDQALVEITLPRTPTSTRGVSTLPPSKDELQQKLMEWIGERG